MSSGNYKSDKINQLLRQRKAERLKVQKYRNKRIKQKYHKLKEQQQERNQHAALVRDQTDLRKIEFYNSVFGTGNLTEAKKENNKNKERPSENKMANERRQKRDRMEESEEQQQFNNQESIDQQLRAPQINTLKQQQRGEHNKNKHVPKYGQIHQNEEGNDSRVSHKKKIEINKVSEKQIQKAKVQQQAQRLHTKVDKLKQRKKKLIKKLDQKNKKGQPIMNNYVKYALTKLEETIAKQKLQSHTQAHKGKEQRLEGKWNKDHQFRNNKKNWHHKPK